MDIQGLKLYKLLIAVSSGIFLNLILGSTDAQAQVIRAKAWVWANQPTSSSYTPDPNYQYNSTGETNEITRLGQGKYSVALPQLGTTGGMVQVSAYGGNHYCKVGSWNASGTTQQIRVYCFSPTGSPVDGRFTALFYKESRGEAWKDAYLWANQPTAEEYIPSTGYQWNSQGLNNKVRRLGTGRYRATLPNINILGGTVLVTAYGEGSEQCKVVNWQRSGNDTVVNVNCFNASGSPVDTRYTLSYMSDVGLGIRVSEDQHYGGYVWANRPTTTSYTPNETYQLNTAGGPNTITRRSVGSYSVRFPLLKAFDITTAQITAYGSSSEYCTIANWNGRSGDYTSVNVNCFDYSGEPVDTRFTLTYLTDEQILF